MTPNKITLHCSDSPDENDKISVSDIRAWHLQRGWKDVGYHYVICRSGTIQKGRPDTEVGAHVEGHNTGNLGICLVGRHRFTREQFASLRILLDRLMVQYPTIPTSEIYGHYQFDTAIKQGKTCPGMQMPKVLRWYFAKEDALIAEYVYRTPQ